MTRDKSSAASDWVDTDGAPDLSTPDWVSKLEAAPVHRGLPPAAAGNASTTILLDAEVVAAFRHQGADWQTRINAVLRDWLDHH